MDLKDKLYEETKDKPITFNFTHGGARQGAGAKPKPNNILYQRRFDKSLVEKMDSYLTELKQQIKK